jgi:membrane protease YdiL (CAAX protease family)
MTALTQALEAGPEAGRSGQLDAWRHGGRVTIGLLALPIAITSLGIRVLFAGLYWSSRMTGATPTRLGPNQAWMLGLAFYAAGLWVATGLAWRWSARRGVVRNVFLFRRLTVLDVALVLALGVAGIIAEPLLSQWFGRWVGWHATVASGANPRYQGVLWLAFIGSVLTAPFCEEVLFRGLIVAWLRARNVPTWALWLLGSLAFAPIHLPAFGLAWTMAVFFWGGMVLAVRLWRDSLTPCWAIHLLSNLYFAILVPVFHIPALRL